MVPQDPQSHASLAQEPILISEALEICWQSQITYHHDIMTQIICYMRFKYIREIFVKKLNCHLYHTTWEH